MPLVKSPHSKQEKLRITKIYFTVGGALSLTTMDSQGNELAEIIIDPQAIGEGIEGPSGVDGYTPIKGVDYFDGTQGQKGDKGDKGEPGESVFLWTGLI